MEAAAQRAADTTLLVNNAGIITGGPIMSGPLDGLHAELGTQLFGTLDMMRAFAPVLGRNGGGAILNVLSAMAWFPYVGGNAYHISKAAAWAATNGARVELAEQNTLVTGLFLGLADTDMSAWSDAPKLSPAQVATAALDGIEAGAAEVLADEWSRTVKRHLAEPPEAFASIVIPD
ncbi:hypothetical protein GCM10022223_32510 [Kineosporia mesophila]|uniref:Short subunit dehydrogenase n=1 Tax=Kineosporia mesophila TaxID=566012 RepID=A0ABP6ZMZ6_9ACTN|nr:SDR family NAD(P)-dependent oxidoreductase [Kineosporia mesophila]